MLPARALSALAPEETWAILDRCERTRVDRELIARRLADRLYQLVPTVNPARRRRVLQVRRDLHNDRLPAPEDIVATEDLLGEEDRASLRSWSESLRAEDRRVQSGADLLATELRAARRSLAEMAASEDFLRGIQLSGKHLYRSVVHYIQLRRSEAAGRDTKRLRQTESTLIRYACRMALRTAPFGSFTEVGAQPWPLTPPPAEGVPTPYPRRSFVRLNRGLLAWMVQMLEHIDGREHLLSFWLDSAVRNREGRLEGFERGTDGGPRGYWGERFVNLRKAGMVGAVADLLAEGPRRWAEVQGFVCGRGASQKQASAFLERLAETGIFRRGLPLSDQTVDLVGDVARRLRSVRSPQAAACAEVFETLHGIEAEFGSATVEERDRMLEEVAHQATRLGEICGVQAPVDVARTLLFEDVAADGPARNYNARLLEHNLLNFERLQRLVPIFDEGTLPRLGLHRWFITQCGARAHGDDVLSVYRSFVEQSQEQISAVMQAVGAQRGDEVRALRAELLELLRTAVGKANDAAVVSLDERCIDDITRSLPAYLPPAEDVSYRVQLIPPDITATAGIVLNGVAAGHGVFFSRFCDVVEPTTGKAWSLGRAVHDAIGRNNPRQADITAVFGLNVNLHPELTPLEIVYPGSIARGTGDTLTLRELRIEADPSSPTLRLIDCRDGRPISFVPMNFIFPAGAPMLYRFLCTLAPLHNIPNDLWRRLRWGHGGEVEHYPRLMLGDVVLARRAWRVPVSYLGRLGDGSAVESPRHLLLVDRLRRAIGLPRHCFFRVQPPAVVAGSSTWQDETRRWAVQARNARLRKQYIDFRSSLLVRLVLSQACSEPDGDVMFEECLPAITAYSDPTRLASAEELLIELTTASDRRSPEMGS